MVAPEPALVDPLPFDLNIFISFGLPNSTNKLNLHGSPKFKIIVNKFTL